MTLTGLSRMAALGKSNQDFFAAAASCALLTGPLLSLRELHCLRSAFTQVIALRE